MYHLSKPGRKTIERALTAYTTTIELEPYTDVFGRCYAAMDRGPHQLNTALIRQS